MTVSRTVTLLTPVFAGLAGWLCDLAARYLPGAPALSHGELTALFVAGATSATAAALKWLHGRSKHELLVQSQQPAAIEGLLQHLDTEVSRLERKVAAVERAKRTPSRAAKRPRAGA